MPTKTGAGGQPQEYDAKTGEYGGEHRQNTSHSAILAEQKRRDAARIYDTTDGPINPRPHPVKKMRGQATDVGEDVIAFVAKELGVSAEEADKYARTMSMYCSDYYSDIRRFQRGEKLLTGEERFVAEMASAIEDYISKSPKWDGGITYRGVALSDDELSSWQVGTNHDMGGTSSWSEVDSVATEFADHNATYGKPNKVIFVSPTQTKGTGIAHLSAYYGEQEVLASKDARYKVLKREQKGDYLWITLKEEM